MSKHANRLTTLLAALIATGAVLGGTGVLSGTSARVRATPASPSGTSARVSSRQLLVGVGDNGAGMFRNPYFKALNTTVSRKLVPWDFYKFPAEVKDLSAWLAGASAAGVEPLITFGALSTRSSTKKLISVKQYKKTLAFVLREYPWVRDVSPWNEANHQSQPTSTNPQRAAEYYNATVQMCSRCNVVAADVLDQPGLGSWIKAFKKYARGTPSIWGLHNYIDVNHGVPPSRSTTKKFLKMVRGQIWLTEVGGLVAQGKKWPYSEQRGADGIGRTFALAALSPRINRVYLYSWYGTNLAGYKHPPYRWDSGIATAGGHPRPAYYELKKFLGIK